MDKEFWLQRWETRHIGFHQDLINPCLVRFWPRPAALLKPRVFVPLCGKSLDMHWLLEQGYRVIGCEISEIAVKEFFSEHGMKPEVRPGVHCMHWKQGDMEILCGDYFSLTPDDTGTIDAFYDRAALIALPPALRPEYARQLASLSATGSTGLLVTLEYNQSETSGPPFMVPATEVEQLLADDFEIEQIYSMDALGENPKFRERGLTELSEHVYRLQRR